MNDFYVYEWFNVNTDEVFYVGKGRKNRYKETAKRNSKFKEYIAKNQVDVRIIIDNLTEQEAFLKEKEIMDNYKEKEQCICNLMEGGSGGVSFTWTDEARKNWSINNPMKSETNRLRMHNNNPMYNKDIALRSGEKHRRAVIIDGVEYPAVKIAAEACGVRDVTISAWCQRGYNTEGKPCRYADESQKEYIIPPKGKAVLIDGIYYSTIKEAAEALGVRDSSPLCKALKSNKLYKGHKCEYANQQPSQMNNDLSNLEGSTTNG